MYVIHPSLELVSGDVAQTVAVDVTVEFRRRPGRQDSPCRFLWREACGCWLVHWSRREPFCLLCLFKALFGRCLLWVANVRTSGGVVWRGVAWRGMAGKARQGIRPLFGGWLCVLC